MIRLVGMAYVALLAGLVFGLYHVSYKTDEAAEAAAELAGQVERTQTEIRTLQSEWSVRTSPDYIAKLTAKFLPEMRPTLPDQHVSLAGLAPREEGAPAGKTIEELLTLVELRTDAGGQTAPRRRPSL